MYVNLIDLNILHNKNYFIHLFKVFLYVLVFRELKTQT